MNIEELMTLDNASFVAAVAPELQAEAKEQEINQSLRQQLRESLNGEEVSLDMMSMLEQKYGLAPVKFTRVEEKVIKKQLRKETRAEEGQHARI